MRVRIVPYNMASNAGRALARNLNVLRTNNDPARSRFIAMPTDMVINFGCANLGGHVSNGFIINTPAAVARAVNKIDTFRVLREAGLNVPDFTTSLAEALRWQADGKTILGRTANERAGTGIVVYESNSTQLRTSRHELYTVYIPKRYEYRVHVLPDRTIVRQKRRIRAETNPNWRIRTHANGFAFARNIEFMPEDLEEVATRAVRVLGLDFGAVDVIYNAHRNTCYVLEVNTAPGMEGDTLTQYTECFRNLIENHRVTVSGTS